MSNTFYKKPVSVEAMQFNLHALTNRSAYNELFEFAGEHLDAAGKPVSNLVTGVAAGKLWVAANDAWVNIELNEWILKDEHGCYPCKPDTFERTYTDVPPEPLDSEPAEDGDAGPEDYTCTCEYDKAHRYDSLKLAALSLSGTTNSTGMEVTNRARLFMHYIETGEIVASLP